MSSAEVSGLAASESRPLTTARYIAPFCAFMALLALQAIAPLPARADFVLRIVLPGALLIFLSRPVLQLRPRFPVSSIVVGAVVFVIWIGPDVLLPHYRQHWLFQNAVFGVARPSVAPAELDTPLMLALRTIRATLIVPVIEELFWRAWLMRWLISQDFTSVRLGAWAPGAFWITALLFASEHGPWWDVGLLAGILYNWWMIRTKSVADCIVAHAVTNGLLCAWVIGAHQWQYWQ